MIPGSNKDHPSFLKSFSYAMEASSPPLRPSATLRSCSWRACAPSLPAASWGSTLPSGPRLSSAVLGDSRRAVQHRHGAIVDLATQELHPLAKRAKDIAAASVYVLSITAAIVGLLVFAHALDFI